MVAGGANHVYSDNMANNDNSVNIKDIGATAARAYHHGDLRAAAIAEGLRLLSEAGETDLGLRALARNLGVSATALYRHFPDKDALLAALAGEGMRQLGALQAKAWKNAGGGEAGFRGTGLAYVQFAHDNPALFRLTFTGCAAGASMPAMGSDRTHAFTLLQQSIAEVLPATLTKAQRAAAALHAWSLVHGLAVLVLDRRIAWDEAQIASVIDMTFGIAKPVAQPKSA